MSEEPDIIIFIVPHTLTDRTKVWDVMLGEHVFNAVSKEDASDMAEEIASAITNYSNSVAEVIYE